MKLEVLQVSDTVRLNLVGETDHEWQQIREFVERLNGGPIDKKKGIGNPAFDCSMRVESIGFDDDENVESVAVEATLEATQK